MFYSKNKVLLLMNSTQYYAFPGFLNMKASYQSDDDPRRNPLQSCPKFTSTSSSIHPMREGEVGTERVIDGSTERTWITDLSIQDTCELRQMEQERRKKEEEAESVTESFNRQKIPAEWESQSQEQEEEG